MRYEHAHHHFSRRDALKIGAAGATVVAAGTVAGALPADAAEESGSADAGGRRVFNDEMFDVEKVIAGGYWVSPYGPDDQRGTLNEVTPMRTSRALGILKPGKPVKSHQLGEEMFNGFPAFPSDPPRLHDMFLYVFGYDAGPDFAAAGGVQSGTTALGPNRVVGHEERFAQNFTFQIASQIDGLGHVGIGTNDERGGWFYNDNYASDIISPVGTTKLGNETMGPIVTRGLVIDVVGLKVANGDTDHYFIAPNGRPVLNGDYRITVHDIKASLQRQRTHAPKAGDVPILHTGWTHLARVDPNRYLSEEPGIYLSESRYFQDRKVAIVATDTWGLETLNGDVTGGNAFPCHQELFGKCGIRIGESFITDTLVDDHSYEGVFIATPENVPGATCGSSAPAFLAQPGRKPRD